jgi:omega-amidase
MKEILRVAAVQSNLVWEDVDANLNAFSEKIKSLKNKEVDLIVLPEMFATGFSMNPQKWAQNMQGSIVSWLLQTAKKYNTHVVGSAAIVDSKYFYNRMIWVSPEGKIQHYNKRHLFAYAGEDKKYTAGKTRVLVDLHGWHVMLNVCYDLRFPVWSRNDCNYSILLNVANWPERRAMHWKQLLVARAIENQAFVIGVNRIGEDGNGINHSGDSRIIDPLGNSLWEANANEEQLFIAELHKKDVLETREKFPFLADRDHFRIEKW